MIDPTTPGQTAGTEVTRRDFVRDAASTAGAFMIVPRHVLGGPGYVPPGDKVNIAFIGVGSQGLRVMLNFLKQPDVHALCVCDPNKSSADYPQWDEKEFCQSVRELLGVSTGWEWLSPGQPIAMPRARGFAGVAGRDPCRQIVEAYYAAQKRSGEYRGCSAYADYRDLLEKENDVDAVVVGTTDSLHAAVSVAAMMKSKHVFCQKPMTHSVPEARLMSETAREKGVATQVAVGNQASETTRQLCEWVWDGAIGPVREVINWSSRPFWPQGIDRPAEAEPVPEGLDWDLWLGPARERPFSRLYHPFVWRGWWDFGAAAIGDMGCYSFDTIFRVLKLGAPASVEASASELRDESFARACIIHYDFPARGEMPPVRLTWYDGGLRPPRPADLDQGKELDAEGLMFVGDRGTILCEFSGGQPRLIPEARMQAYTQPAKTLPRSPGNEREWLDACKGGGTKPGANFEFSGVVTEALVLGNIAVRSGRRLIWDRAGLKTGSAAADSLIQPEHRPGFLF